MTTTYRKQFDKTDKAKEYDADVYGLNSYSDLLWQIEQSQLETIIKELRDTHETIDYLDFAAGTGRIISFMEDKVDSATGIEISQAMIDRAREKLTRGKMICADITAEDSVVEGTYDLITTFRFVLNAEPNLRQAGINALAKRLKDDNSILIFNNHGNLLSLKLLLWPLHKIRGLGKGYRTAGNYMTNGQAHRAAEKAGLKIIKTIGCGFFGGTIAKILPTKILTSLERAFANSRLLRPVCVNQLYVAKRKT